MFIRHEKKVINTDNIRVISIHEDERFMGTGEPKNYVTIYFTDKDQEKLYFDSSDEINKFLNLLNTKNF
ncbi:hypothetical protein PA3_32990 [Acinetobacter pittii]|uniref:Uncharacterized protein n=1 Tax=Acinetobacter pittii TaxID=48296 RepID=A0A4Y3JAZ4_ACIPI|nr:hypothetical protein PA3_32990 [Acinetobacter pittii]